MDCTLLIDIDDTLLRPVPGLDPPAVLGHPLLAIAVECAAPTLNRDEALRRVQQLMHDKIWWHWGDYLHTLELDANAFWTIAFEKQRLMLEPLCTRLPHHFQRLRDAGYQLAITSNNPVDGIAFKLRLAGLGPLLDDGAFIDLIGTDTVCSMKWHTAFWHRTLDRLGLAVERVAVLGDSWIDDVIVPGSIGIEQRWFLGVPPDRHNREPGLRALDNWDCLTDAMVDAASQPDPESLRR